MARRMRALSQREVDATKDFGLHGVAPNLALPARPNGSRSWIWRGRIDGVEVQRGLGATRDVSLAEAKARVEEIRVDLRKGRKSDKHAAQWESTMRICAKPVLGKLPVDEISVERVA